MFNFAPSSWLHTIYSITFNSDCIFIIKFYMICYGRIFTCVLIFVQLHVHMGEWRSTFAVIHYQFLPYLLRICFSLMLAPFQLDWLARKLPGHTCVYLPLHHTYMKCRITCSRRHALIFTRVLRLEYGLTLIASILSHRSISQVPCS